MTQILWVAWMFGLATQSVAAAGEEEFVPPRTVAYEAVISDLVFRTSTFPLIESYLVVINSDADPALLEMEFFFSDGRSATDFFNQIDPDPNLIGFRSWGGQDLIRPSQETGRFYRVIPPHTLLELDFPGVRNPLVGQDFSGWAKLRSNRAVAAFQEVVVRSDPEQEASQIRNTVSLGRTLEGRLFAGASSCEIVRVGMGRIGSTILKTGIALTNPDDEQMTVRLELRDRRQTRALAPRSKTTFLIDEIFPFLNKEPDCATLQQLLVLTEDGAGFSAAAVEVRLSVDLQGRLLAANTDPPLSFVPAREFRMPIESGYGFPEEVLAEVDLGANQVTLTRFGFALRPLDGGLPDKVFPYSIGGETTQAGVGVPEESDVALVYGSPVEGFGVVFRSGKVEFVPYRDCCTETPMFERLEADQVRIILGAPCWRQNVVVDTQQEVILSTEVSRDPGAVCF